MVMSVVGKSTTVLISSAIVVAAASCGLVTGIGDLSRAGDALDASVEGAAVDAALVDAGDAASADGSSLSDGPTMEAGLDGACPGTAGPPAIRVGAFCIDATEVTSKDYNVFLATSTAPANAGPPRCSSKTTHAPTGASGGPRYPQAFIDWCDAYAYCAWAGKRLCGHVAGGPSGSLVNATNQWFTACSHGGGGVHAWPYGNVYKPFTCNTPEVDAGGTVPVGSLLGCTGGYPGIFDMTGNVYEWEDSCDTDTAAAHCVQRSGGFFDPSGPSQTCAYSRVAAAGFADNDIGFRCCSP